MKKMLCIFAAGMCVIAVSGQSFVQETALYKTIISNQSFFNKDYGLGYVMPVLSEDMQTIDFKSVKLSEEATIQLDSICIGEYDKTTEMWVRTGKYKLGYDNSDTASYYNTYIWNETIRSWDVYPQDVKKFDANGNVIQRTIMNGITDGKTFNYYSKKEYFFNYSKDGHTESIVSYVQDSYNQDFVVYSKVEIAYDVNGRKTFTQTSLWNSQVEGKWQPMNKEEMEYDENGNQTSKAAYSWQIPSNSWQGVDKYAYEFDKEGHKQWFVLYRWNYETDSWLFSSKTEYSSYVNKFPTIETNYNWDNVKRKWTEFTKKETTLDEFWYTTNIVNFEWDTITSNWQNSYNQRFVYDNKHNLLLTEVDRWNKQNNTWQSSGKSVKTYNENNQILTFADYTWDESLKDWVGSRKDSKEYDEKGNEVLYSIYSWDIEKKDWSLVRHVFKTEYDYINTPGDYTAISFSWNESDSTWIKTTKLDFARKELNKYYLDVLYKWNYASEEWVFDHYTERSFNKLGNPILNISLVSYGIQDEMLGNKIEYDYSDDGLYNEMRGYVWDNSLKNWVGSLKSTRKYLDSEHLETHTEYSWDLELDDWMPSKREVYYYTQTAIENDKQTAKSGINIFPNPASDFVTINFENPAEMAKFELFDLNGRKLIDQQISTGEKVSLNQNKSGVYLWRLNQNGQIFGGKIMIR